MSAQAHCCQFGSAVDRPLPAACTAAPCCGLPAGGGDSGEARAGGGEALRRSSASSPRHTLSSMNDLSAVNSCPNSPVSVLISCPPALHSASNDVGDTAAQQAEQTDPQQPAPSVADISVDSAAKTAASATATQSSSSSPSSAYLSCSACPVPCPVPGLCPRVMSRRRRALLVCLALACLLLAGAGVAVGVLYPQPPSITAHSLRLVRLTVDLAPSAAAAAAADGRTPPVNVSAVLSVSFTLHNPNAYAAHHYASAVAISSLPPSAPLSGQLSVPAGFIAARGDEELASSVQVSTAITAPEQVAQWEAAGMRVQGRADTRGYVDFLFGLRVPYTVHTLCTATLTLRMQQSAVDVSQQRCSNGL